MGDKVLSDFDVTKKEKKEPPKAPIKPPEGEVPIKKEETDPPKKDDKKTEKEENPKLVDGKGFNFRTLKSLKKFKVVEAANKKKMEKENLDEQILMSSRFAKADIKGRILESDHRYKYINDPPLYFGAMARIEAMEKELESRWAEEDFESSLLKEDYRKKLMLEWDKLVHDGLMTGEQVAEEEAKLKKGMQEENKQKAKVRRKVIDDHVKEVYDLDQETLRKEGIEILKNHGLDPEKKEYGEEDINTAFDYQNKAFEDKLKNFKKTNKKAYKMMGKQGIIEARNKAAGDTFMFNGKIRELMELRQLEAVNRARAEQKVSKEKKHFKEMKEAIEAGPKEEITKSQLKMKREAPTLRSRLSLSLDDEVMNPVKKGENDPKLDLDLDGDIKNPVKKGENDPKIDLDLDGEIKDPVVKPENEKPIGSINDVDDDDEGIVDDPEKKKKKDDKDKGKKEVEKDMKKIPEPPPAPPIPGIKPPKKDDKKQDEDEDEHEEDINPDPNTAKKFKKKLSEDELIKKLNADESFNEVMRLKYTIEPMIKGKETKEKKADIDWVKLRPSANRLMKCADNFFTKALDPEKEELHKGAQDVKGAVGLIMKLDLFSRDLLTDFNTITEVDIFDKHADSYFFGMTELFGAGKDNLDEAMGLKNANGNSQENALINAYAQEYEGALADYKAEVFGKTFGDLEWRDAAGKIGVLVSAGRKFVDVINHQGKEKMAFLLGKEDDALIKKTAEIKSVIAEAIKMDFVRRKIMGENDELSGENAYKLAGNYVPNVTTLEDLKEPEPPKKDSEPPKKDPEPPKKDTEPPKDPKKDTEPPKIDPEPPKVQKPEVKAQDQYNGMQLAEIMFYENVSTKGSLNGGIGVMADRPVPLKKPDGQIEVSDDKMAGSAKHIVDKNDEKYFYGTIDNKPNMAQIRQSQAINDCYLISTLAGIMKTNPDYITDFLIKPDPDYKNNHLAIVHLFDGDGALQEIKVDVTPFVDPHRALWVQAIEKAAAVLVDGGRFDDQGFAVLKKNNDWKKALLEDKSVDVTSLSNGSEQLASLLFFGRSGTKLSTRAEGIYDQNTGEAKTEDYRMGYAAIGRALAYVAANKIVTASTCSKGESSKYNILADSVEFPERVRDQLHTRHVYLIVGKGDPVGGMPSLKVRDPYDGKEISLTYTEFSICFTDIYVSGVEGMEEVL